MINKDKNSYDFTEVYEKLKIDIKKLGAVMLNVEWEEKSKEILKSLFSTTEPYNSDSKSWIKGLVGISEAHLTLLYGLLDTTQVEDIQKVLEDIDFTNFNMIIEDFSYFESPQNEDYYCIIAKIKLTEDVLHCHKSLSLLPHINTFLDYKAHITLGYIQKDTRVLSGLLSLLRIKARSLNLDITHVDYDNNSGNPEIIWEKYEEK